MHPRVCQHSPLLLLITFAAVLAGCDDTATPPSRSDAGDAPSDVSGTEVTPDRSSTDTGPAAGCPASAPATDQACTYAEVGECIYRNEPCPDGRPRERLCACVDGKWSCIQDLGCNTDEPAQATPPARCQGSCTAGATCSYVVEKCPAADDLRGRCVCTNGTWSCSRDYDCYPPNTCRQGADQICWTNGLSNTGNFCPDGSTPGPCTAFRCQLGDRRDPQWCSRPGAGPRSPACVYGSWACPIGYTHPIRLP